MFHFRVRTILIAIVLFGLAGLGIYFDSQSQSHTPARVTTNTQPPMNLRPKIPSTSDERRKSLAEIRSINDRVVAENFPSDLQIGASLAQPSRQDATIAAVSDPFSKVTAEGVYVLTINTETNNVETIYSRRARTAFPIASISKMMALVTSDLTAPATSSVVISTSTKAVYPNDTLFNIGDRWTKEDLIPAIVIPSNNVAIEALAELHGVKDFVDTMNAVSKEIGMTGTKFVNATGLDEATASNMATPRDVAILGAYLIKNRPDILALSRLTTHSFTRSDGKEVTLKNTNGSLTDETIPWKVVGGKTGTTARAGQALLLITESPVKDTYIVAVVLRSQSRTKDMALVLNGIKQLASFAPFIQ